MKKWTVALTASFTLTLAAPQVSSPPPSPSPQDLGGIISLLCQFGDIEVGLGDWKLNLCALLGLFKEFNTNLNRFNLTMGKVFKDLDNPLISAATDTGVVGSMAREVGVALPDFPNPEGHRGPGEIYQDAYENDVSPADAEKEALKTIESAYKDYFTDLEKATEDIKDRLTGTWGRIEERRKRISQLQDQLSLVTPGTPEAESLIRQIFQEQDQLTQEAKILASHLSEAKRIYTATQASALQAVRHLDRAVSATKAKTPTLAAAQAAKRISEKTEDILNTIKETEEKTKALVEEAQNATSTRAAVQIAVKGLAQLTQGNVVMQSLLYQALAELAQQNVYTNQQLAYQTERLADILGGQVAATAQEAANEVGYVMGQLDAAVGTARGVRELWKSVLKPTRCNWYREPEKCLEAQN
ncbi:hypothetical protein HRbin39_00029 [bacterium HR39]|nr:hypothetical protein HRbin39_00029 [bacterium HR39]